MNKEAITTEVVLDHLVLDPSSNKPKPACKKKGTRPKKAKINTKVAEVATDKVEKKANQAPKDPR
jgi:23S rRNA pseudouridine2605 synthase